MNTTTFQNPERVPSSAGNFGRRAGARRGPLYRCVDTDISMGAPADAQDAASRLYHVSPAYDALMPQARLLLARVVARLPSRTPHLVQLLSFDGLCGSRAASAFCHAAAEELGAVLQAEPVLAKVDEICSGQVISPDGAVPNLFHGRLTIRAVDLVRRGRAALLQAGEIDLGNYEMVVVDFPCLGDSLEHAMIASIFGGTVLVAKAGATTGPQLRAAARAVQQAGGLVLGIVLLQVPRRPSWIDWLSA